MAGFLAVDSETGNTPGQVREGYGKLRLLALPSSDGPGRVQRWYDFPTKVPTQLNLLSRLTPRSSAVTCGLPVGGGLQLRPARLRQGTGSALLRSN